MTRPPRTTASLPVTCVLGLVGGLGLVAAFFMPWFGTQGLLLSGQFVHQFLSGGNDVRRFMPGVGPQEAQQLRLLVDLFPACGLLGAVLALLAGLRDGHGLAWGVVLAVVGVVPLLA